MLKHTEKLFRLTIMVLAHMLHNLDAAVAWVAKQSCNNIPFFGHFYMVL